MVSMRFSASAGGRMPVASTASSALIVPASSPMSSATTARVASIT